MLKKEHPLKDQPLGSASPENPLQVFDYNELLDRTMGDRELAINILEEFVGLIGQHGKKLQQAVESGDHENIRQISHLIKGESGNISAQALYKNAYAMEKAGKAKNSAEQNALLPTILRDIGCLTKAIREVLQKESK